MCWDGCVPTVELFRLRKILENSLETGNIAKEIVDFKEKSLIIPQ